MNASWIQFERSVQTIKLQIEKADLGKAYSVNLKSLSYLRYLFHSVLYVYRFSNMLWKNYCLISLRVKNKKHVTLCSNSQYKTLKMSNDCPDPCWMTCLVCLKMDTPFCYRLFVWHHNYSQQGIFVVHFEKWALTKLKTVLKVDMAVAKLRPLDGDTPVA